MYFILKQRCKALECEFGYLQIEKLELSAEKLNTENKALDDRLNEFQNKFKTTEELICDLQTKLKEHNEQQDTLVTNKDFLNSLLIKSKAKVSEMSVVTKEQEDNILLLEQMVRNKNLEIDTLKAEKASTIVVQTTVSCEECAFTSESEKGVKIHMGRMHETVCDDCKEKFAGNAKLKTHICRMHIDNPNSELLYMKNWVVRDTCIRVFSHSEQQEVALLHCKQCTGGTPCSEFPPGLANRVRQDDENDLIHLRAENYLRSTKIDWGFIQNHIFEAGPDKL